MAYVLDSIGAGGGFKLELDDVSDSHDAILLDKGLNQLN